MKYICICVCRCVCVTTTSYIYYCALSFTWKTWKTNFIHHPPIPRPKCCYYCCYLLCKCHPKPSLKINPTLRKSLAISLFSHFSHSPYFIRSSFYFVCLGCSPMSFFSGSTTKRISSFFEEKQRRRFWLSMNTAKKTKKQTNNINKKYIGVACSPQFLIFFRVGPFNRWKVQIF